MNDRDGKRLALDAAIRQEFSDAVAVDDSVANGRAYLAYCNADGTVRPMYLWLERDEFGVGEVMYKHVGLDRVAETVAIRCRERPDNVGAVDRAEVGKRWPRPLG